VELAAEPQEPELFALSESEPDPTLNGMAKGKKVKKSKVFTAKVQEPDGHLWPVAR
jgi:hypothetical protein